MQDKALQMNVMIIEDELLLAEQLAEMVTEFGGGVKVLSIATSVAEALTFLKKNSEHVDLIFSDIQLTDGLSFEIFQKMGVEIPVIFITAYDRYAIEAFRTTSIDYLLKPIDRDALETAIEKYKRMMSAKTASIDIKLLQQIIKPRSYKSRFMIKVGDKILTIDSRDVFLFASVNKATYIFTSSGKRYIIDYSIEQLAEELNPNSFFQVSRKYIVNIDGIDHVTNYSNSRMKVTIKNVELDEIIIVSRDRTSRFKDWLKGVS